MPDAPRSTDGAAVAVGDGASGDSPNGLSHGEAVAVGDGAFAGDLVAQRDAPVGGQAVLEGVMMRGISTWAVAVRKPLPEQLKEGGLETDEIPLGEIEVVTHPLTSVLKKHRLLRLPLIRGVVALGESLGIGFKALGISANAQLPEDEKEISGGVWAGTVVVALVFAIGLFFVIPVGLTSLIKDQLNSSFLFWLVEGVVRTGDLPRLPAGALAAARPAPRLRVPRRRAQDDLLLRGRAGADARRTRSASAACTRAVARASCSS